MSLRYDDEYEVERFDQVEVRIGNRWEGRTFDGVVTRLHPRSGEVTVRYEDCYAATRNGDPRKKTARVPVSAVDLVARDG